jgi:hypothetical protein
MALPLSTIDGDSDRLMLLSVTSLYGSDRPFPLQSSPSTSPPLLPPGPPGAFDGAEKRSSSVGARSALRPTNLPRMFERSGWRPRSEFLGTTGLRASQGSPAL